MVNALVRSFTGNGAQAAAEAFITTIDEAKIISVSSYATADIPTITVVYKA
jgi:hypothetical protein